MLPVEDAAPVPPAPTSAIDWSHLNHVTLGDPALADEVLGLFLEQVDAFQHDLDAASDAAPALVHRLKGAARAIGAWPIADAAQALERVLRSDDATAAVAALDDRIKAARAAIGRHPRTDAGGAGAAQTDSV